MRIMYGGGGGYGNISTRKDERDTGVGQGESKSL